MNKIDQKIKAETSLIAASAIIVVVFFHHPGTEQYIDAPHLLIYNRRIRVHIRPWI